MLFYRATEGFHKNLQPSLMKTTENFNAFQLKYTSKTSGKPPTLIQFFRQIQMYAIDVRWLDIFFCYLCLTTRISVKYVPKNTWDTNKCQISATIHRNLLRKDPDFHRFFCSQISKTFWHWWQSSCQKLTQIRNSQVNFWGSIFHLRFQVVWQEKLGFK